MPFDAERHHRRSTRYPEFDYASANAYFVTMGTHARLSLFGEIVDSELILNDLSAIAQTC